MRFPILALAILVSATVLVHATGGLIQISSEPMRNALSQLGKWGL